MVLGRIGITLLFVGIAGWSAAQETAGSLYKKAEALRIHAKTPADYQTAMDLYQQSADMGKGGAYYRIGAIELRLGEPEKALVSWGKAAESGSKSAPIALAKGHAAGIFGGRSDPSKGVPVLEHLAQDPTQDRAVYALAELLEKGTGTKPDPKRAVDLFKGLAEAGNARGQRKFGRYFIKGFDAAGLPKDLNQAAFWLEKSAAQGYGSAFKDLGSVYGQMGQAQKAISALETAVEKDVSGAKAELANGHYRGHFGALSDIAKGRKDLKTMAEAGNIYATRYAMRHHERRSRRLKDMDFDLVVSNLWSAAETGDRNAVRTLSRMYRRLSWLFTDEKDKLKVLVDTYPQHLGPEGVVADTVSILYDPNHHRTSRKVVAQYLESLTGPGFAAGALRLRSIERTSFVYLVQRQLRNLGLYNGPADAKMGRGTIRAISKLCRANGVGDVCKHGPLLYSTSLNVANILEAQR